jgi:phosphoenolpyruvate carboxykinase (ATP)
MKLAYTRRMVSAILSGELSGVEMTTEPFFNLTIPTSVPDVPTEVLNPRDTWEDPAAYDAQAAKLVDMFKENFKSFEEDVSDEVRAAGPN